MKWPLCSMGDFFRVKHGYAFEGRHFEAAGPYVLLTPGSFNEEGGYRDQGDKTKFYTGDVPDGFILEEGDLIVAMTEQAPGLLGSSALVPESGRFLHNQRLGRIIGLDERRLRKPFLYYLFNTKTVRDQISSTATGGKVRHTAPNRIGQVKFLCPPPETQDRIADILSAYDDLLHNNRRRMALLEQAARQLYREWFVHLRFPGRERVPPSGNLPRGWRQLRLGDIAECVGGGTPSTKVPAFWDDGTITWVTPTDVTRNEHFVLLDSARKITETGLSNSSATIVPPHAVLMSSRASVGFFAVAGREVCTNQGFISVVASDPVYAHILLFQLVHRVDAIRLMGSGSTYPEVSRGKFREFEVLVPPKSIAAAFDDYVSALLAQIRALKLQNKALQTARDLLLPRLMSGELAA